MRKETERQRGKLTRQSQSPLDKKTNMELKLADAKNCAISIIYMITIVKSSEEMT